MDENIKMPDDPKFDLIIRKIIYNLTNAWTLGDVKTAGRAIDALKNTLWGYLNERGRNKLNAIRFKPKTAEDMYTKEDTENLSEYGELEDDRIVELNVERDRANRSAYMKCREQEWKFLMIICDALNLGLSEDTGDNDDTDSKKYTSKAPKPK